MCIVYPLGWTNVFIMSHWNHTGIVTCSRLTRYPFFSLQQAHNSVKCWINSLTPCPKPSSQPRDAARREECSQLDEKSLTTFLLLNGRAKGSGAVHLKWKLWDLKTTQKWTESINHSQYLSRSDTISLSECEDIFVRVTPGVSGIPSIYAGMRGRWCGRYATSPWWCGVCHVTF